MALVLNDQQRLSFEEVLDRKKGLSLNELSRRLAEFEQLAAEGLITEDEHIYHRLLMETARINAIRGNYPKAFEILAVVQQLCVTHGNRDCELCCRNNMALVKKELGEIFEAIDLWQKLLQEELELSDRILYINNLGVAYCCVMKPKLAIETYFEALKHLDDNDESEIAADIYNNLGEVFRSSGDADKALEYFDKARNIYIKAENNERMALIYNNLAATNIITNDIPKAEEFCQLAMEYYKKYLTEPYFPVALNNLASLRSNQQRFDEAIELYNESLTIAKKYGNESLQTTVLNNLALIAIEREDYDTAVNFAQESLSTAQKLQDLISEKKAYSSLKDAWQFQLDIARAYLAQSMELELAQRINEVNTPLDIAQAEAMFLQKRLKEQLDAYRTQNETLEDSYKTILHKTQELETKNNLLSATNRLLNRIISIITHDVRGPVATISQASEMLISGLLTENKDETLKLLHQSSKVTEELINDLLQLAARNKSGLDEEPVVFDLIETLQESVQLAEIVAQPKGIRIKYSFENEVLMIRLARERLRLIIRNLFSNAIKFSHPESTIHLKASSDKEMLHISLSDEGVGMSASQIERILSGNSFSGMGTQQEKGFGMGLVFVLEALQHTGGTLEIQSSPGQGSTFTVSYHLQDLQ